MKLNKIILNITLSLILLFSVNCALITNNEAYWTLDNTLNDSTGNGHTAQTSTATYISSGKINGAYSFNGINNFMTLYDVPNNEIKSISLWIKVDSVSISDIQHIVDGGTTNPQLSQIQRRGDLTGDPLHIYASDGTNYKYYEFNNPFLTNTNWYYITILTIGNTIKLYVNGDEKTAISNGGSGSGFLYFNSDFSDPLSVGRRQNSNDRFFKGDVDEISLWSRELTQSEITELYNNNTGLQYPYSVGLNRTIEQQYTQTQTGTLILTSSNYVDILSGNFNITQNNSNNYGSSSLSLQSNDTNLLTCRVNIDNITGTEYNYTTIPNIVSTMPISRGNITLNKGLHNITVECKKTGSGQIQIGFAKGIGHILKSKNGNILNYDHLEFSKNITSGSSYTKINSTRFTTKSNKDNLNKYMVIEWGAIFTNNYASPEIIKSVIEIGGFECGKFENYIEPGHTQTSSGTCIASVNQNTFYDIDTYVSGVNSSSFYNINIKEFDLKDKEQFYYTYGYKEFSTLEKLYSFNLTNNVDNSRLFLELSSTVKNSGGLGLLYFNVTSTDFKKKSQNTAQTFSSNKNTLNVENSIKVPTGDLQIDIYGECSSGTCIIEKTELSAYIVENVEFINNSLLLKSFNTWNSSQINNFSITTSEGLKVNSTGGQINLFTDNSYLDIEFKADDYITRNYFNHITEYDLNASLYQSILYLDSQEIYTNNSINSFSVDTETGTYSTINGSLILYPNIKDYLFDWSSSNYYSNDNIEINISGTNNYYTFQNNYDTILNFKAENTSTIYPSCLWQGNNLISDYKFANQQTDNNINCTLQGFQKVSINNYGGSFTVNDTITMNISKIVLKIYDRQTDNILTGLTQVQVIATTGYEANTTTGYLNISNIDFIDETYTMILSHEGYGPELIYFNYDNQEILEVNVFMLNASATEYGQVVVKTITDAGELIGGAVCSALEWKPELSAYQAVTYGETNMNGETTLDIELGTKIYKFNCYKGDVSKTSVSQVIKITDQTIPIVLTTTITKPANTIENFQYSLINSSINSSHQRITFDFTDINGLVATGCLKIYKKVGTKLTELQGSCVSASTGEIQLIQNVNQTYYITAIATIEQDGVTFNVDEINYIPFQSLQNFLKKYAFDIILPILFTFIGMSMGLLTKPQNIYISIIGSIVMVWLSVAIVPSVVSSSIAIFVTTICLIMFWGGSKNG